MKILLILLLMVALIGGWYVWTSSRNANVISSSGTGTTGTGGPDNSGTDGEGPVTIEGAPTNPTPGTGAVDPATGSVGSDGTATGNGTGEETSVESNVAPDGTVTIPTLPPLGNDDGTVAGPNGEGSTVATPAPGGINPDTPLVLLPGVNPFRPLSVKTDANAAGTTPTGSVTAVNPSSGNTTPSNTGTPNSGGAASNGSPDPLGINGGAVPISPIPGSGETVPSDSAEVSGGAFPLPNIPGADGSGTDSSGADSGVTITPGLPTVTPLPTTPDTVTADNGGNSATGNAGTSTNGAGTNTAVTPPVERPLPPIKPPVAGVSVPGVSRVPNLNANTGTTGTANNGANGAASGTDAGVTASLPTTAPRPGTPQVITELAPIGTDTPAETARPLDQGIAARELAFNAVVLGPVNTAIFRSKDGFLVVSVGQTLPDSDIVIKEVTATSATLALGNDTQTLELDKR